MDYKSKILTFGADMLKLVELLFLMAVLLCGCVEHHEVVVLSGQEDFREGDLVLRCGYGVESQVVTETSHSIYSHIGILHYDGETAQWLAIHAVPGEAEADEPELLKAEPLEEFFAYDRAIRGAWMRVDCSDSIAAAAALYALTKVAEKVEFDNDYLLGDTTQLYCSELVWRAYLHQGIDISEGRRHDVPVLFCPEGECIFPCDIEECKKIIFVKPFNTTRQ